MEKIVLKVKKLLAKGTCLKRLSKVFQTKSMPPQPEKKEKTPKKASNTVSNRKKSPKKPRAKDSGKR